MTGLTEALDSLRYYYDAGGLVMLPLAIFAVVLWYALGYRLSAVRRGSQRSVRNLIERYQAGKWRKPRGILHHAVIRGVAMQTQQLPYLRRHLDDAFGDFKPRLERFALVSRVIISSAPLLGLLGTVSGMIETFDSLADAALFTQDGGIAVGISQALITTQLGLAIAIPGLLVSRMIDRRQNRIETDLAQIKDILCSQAVPA